MELLVGGIVVAIVVLWVTCARGRNRGHPGGLQLPPGPRPLPVLGNLLQFSEGKSLPEHFSDLAAKYGPIVYIWLGANPGVVISSVEMARIVLKEKDEMFADRPPRTYCFQQLVEPDHDISFSAYGPEWRHLRKLLYDTVLSQKRLQQSQYIKEEEISAVVRSIRSCSLRGKTESERTVDVQLQCRAINMNIGTRVMMGKRFFVMPGESGDESAPVDQPPTEGIAMEKALLSDVIAALTSEVMFGDMVPWLGFLDVLRGNAKNRIKEIKARAEAPCAAILEERRKFVKEHGHHEPEDSLDVFLAAQKELGDQEVSDSRIKAFMKSVLAALADSGNNVQEWAMAELLKHPDQMRKVQEELDLVVGKERKVKESDIPNLPFLHAVLKESLRLHPSGGMTVPHYCRENTEVGGFLVPAGTIVYINSLAIGRDPAVWEQPDSFLPERFMDNPEIDLRGNHVELIPFGAGRRSCPGLNLGLGIMQLFLARFAHSFDWELVRLPVDLGTPIGNRRGPTLLGVASPRLPPHCY